MFVFDVSMRNINPKSSHLCNEKQSKRQLIFLLETISSIPQVAFHFSSKAISRAHIELQFTNESNRLFPNLFIAEEERHHSLNGNRTNLQILIDIEISSAENRPAIAARNYQRTNDIYAHISLQDDVPI